MRNYENHDRFDVQGKKNNEVINTGLNFHVS